MQLYKPYRNKPVRATARIGVSGKRIPNPPETLPRATRLDGLIPACTVTPQMFLRVFCEQLPALVIFPAGRISLRWFLIAANRIFADGERGNQLPPVFVPAY